MDSPRSSLSLECLEGDSPPEDETFGADDFFPPAEFDLGSTVGHQEEAQPLPPPEITEAFIPLRQWIRDESLATERQLSISIRKNQHSVIRKTTVAYAIAELLQYHLDPPPAAAATAAAAVSSRDVATDLGMKCNLDNFVVRFLNNGDNPTIIEGVDMISPSLSSRVSSPFFLSEEFLGIDDNDNGHINGRQEELGRFYEIEVESNSSSSVASYQLGPNEENAMCHLFGLLLYELYSERRPFPGSDEVKTKGSSFVGNHSFARMDVSSLPEAHEEPLRKKTPSDVLSLHGETIVTLNDNSSGSDGVPEKMTSSHDIQVSRDNPRNGKSSGYTPLQELRVPVSISLLVKNLIDCGWDGLRPDDAILSLHTAVKDLHLLLLDPNRFLFDRIPNEVVKGLDFAQNKLQGRDAAVSLITNIFCRVSLTGDSEVLLIDGFSGSGKSALVESVVSYIDMSGGYIARKKFDPILHERPISVVIAAFNDLCPIIRAKNSPQDMNEIVNDLKAVFGNHLSALARLLPNVALLIPELGEVCLPDRGGSAEINLSRVYFILQLFSRVVSSKCNPIMLFLDDLHWADSFSLNVLQHILTDIKGSSTIYMIGSYRSNQAPKDHGIFRFTDDLDKFSVRLSKVHLDGLDIENVNHIISNALGIFPRVCRPLSRVVLRKTKGNPLFVLECLRSLVDRGLLQYSMRKRRWVWDTDAVGAEDIADNVCELLSMKMTSLREETQFALKVASCFGTTLDSTVVNTLMSASAQLSTFQKELESAVDEGFLDKDSPRSSYRFAHDKVREAAYGLIREEERNEFHNNIGRLLNRETLGQNIDSMIFFIVDQINHGTISDPRQRISNAELNYKAASKAMQSSNNEAAFFYINVAVKLLPKNHWESHYELSRSIFLVLGNAAYSGGHNKEATSALDSILRHGKSLKDKLDAYYLKIALLHSHQEGKPAYDTCIEVLEQLGESIPASIEPEIVVHMVTKMQSDLNKMAENDSKDMKIMDSPFHYSLMQFYEQVAFISYFVNTPMFKWFTCRSVEISLEHGFCKYSASSIMRFSMVLGGKLINNVQGSYRVGKMAIKLLERFDATDLLPMIYMCYYGFVAVHMEPLQSCADMLKRAFEIGLSIGETQVALMNGAHYIQKRLFSGANLSILKKECDYQLRLLKAHSQPMTKLYTKAWQNTIAMLIANEEELCSPNWSNEDTSNVKEFSESIILHRVLRNFWLGHYDRCLYYAEKSAASTDIGQLKSIMIIFYGGLSCFHSMKKCSKKHMKLAKKAVRVLRENGEKSSWNYQSKIHLLAAEILSASDEKDKAKISFNAAISSARSSKFIHEEGLACELAALHCLRVGDIEDASNLLKQAKVCYTKWGSQVKVDLITEQLQNFLREESEVFRRNTQPFI